MVGERAQTVYIISSRSHLVLHCSVQSTVYSTSAVHNRPKTKDDVSNHFLGTSPVSGVWSLEHKQQTMQNATLQTAE